MAKKILAWSDSASQYYREIGKREDGKPHRFYVGDDDSVYNVGELAFVFRPHGSHPATDEDPQRVLDEEWLEVSSLVTEEPLLLEEGQQAGGQVEAAFVLVGVIGEVEDAVVFAEAVLVEVFVGVVEQDA